MSQKNRQSFLRHFSGGQVKGGCAVGLALNGSDSMTNPLNKEERLPICEVFGKKGRCGECKSCRIAWAKAFKLHPDVFRND